MVCDTTSRVVPATGADDRQLGPRQRIEQRALAGIGLAGDHDLDALAQQGALAGPLLHRGQLGLQRRQLARGVGLLQEIDLLVGKVERRLDQHAQAHQRLEQGVDLVARRRPTATGWRCAPRLRCWRRSGRRWPRPAPGRSCR